MRLNKKEKIQYFEFFCLKILKEYLKSGGNLEDNDLGIIKAMNLLFFTTAIDIKKDGKNELINNIFDNWSAVPWGYREDDIYDYFVDYNGGFKMFNLTHKKIVLHPKLSVKSLSNF